MKIITQESKLPKPKTENQKEYVQLMHTKMITFVTGPAGTGKTMLACSKAVELFEGGIIDKIIIVRPLVTVDEPIGFLPGGLNDKIGPYLAHAMDYFQGMLGATAIKNMLVTEEILIVPLALLRGKTFDRSFVILDEMQNSTALQMKTALTRIGNSTKMVVIGDLNQRDLLGAKKDGLSDFLGRLTEHQKIGRIEMTKDDILRNGIIKDILTMYGE